MVSLERYKREISAATAFAALLIIVGIIAPSFFSGGNLRDLVINNAPTLLVAVGMTLVILAGQIDISVGSQFAVCSVAAGVLAKTDMPLPLVLIGVVFTGAAMGALNGILIGGLKLPSIIVTLAMLVIWRDALRWLTEGAWVQDLPADFQWFGFGQGAGELLIVAITAVLFLTFAWSMKNMVLGRKVYAVGSDAEATRLAGIDPQKVVFWIFVIMGALVGLAALLNAIRFSSIPGNSGVGLELKAIAAVVVGGTAITGGRGRLVGTLIGVALLGTIGTALTFVGINPFWEKAIQGAIILAALASDVALGRLEKHGHFNLAGERAA
ncbi:MAG TPA: ABC transporter permease [Pyrinomonadaceae bacterium]|jgi:rhamnose transport system permease protein|nr:ABC transporter permease [Pyrinomonadaceae bacterium]